MALVKKMVGHAEAVFSNSWSDADGAIALTIKGIIICIAHAVFGDHGWSCAWVIVVMICAWAKAAGHINAVRLVWA